MSTANEVNLSSAYCPPPPGHVPPDTYPKDIYPPISYPLDTYPPDIYPLGHVPPRTYTPQTLKCPIWFMHHVLITPCTLKGLILQE